MNDSSSSVHMFLFEHFMINNSGHKDDEVRQAIKIIYWQSGKTAYQGGDSKGEKGAHWYE